MKVGVIVPVRDAMAWIEALVETVRAQTWRGPGRRVGLYLADDWSTDGLWEFLQARPSWWDRYDLTPARLGWAGALNHAADMAIGDGCDAVMTCSADDFLRVDAVEACVETLRAGVDGMPAGFCIATSREVGGSNVVQRSREGAVLADFGRWPPVTDKALIPVGLWRRVGGYSTDCTPSGTFGSAEDWEFWIKVWKALVGPSRFPPAYRCTADPVYYWRVHPGQLSHGRPETHAAALDMIMAKHPDVPWHPRVKEWPPVADDDEVGGQQ